MRKIFLDVGAYKGSSVEFFRRNRHDADSFEIHCFEPLKENIKGLRKIPNIVIVPAAAWISNGTADMYLGKPKSGSMYADKITGLVDVENKIEVVTIDLADYIIKNFQSTDEIWLKLNAEGAEYEIVPHLNKHGLIPWFDRLYIRWHASKIPSLAGRHKEMKRMVPNAVGVWKKKSIVPL